MANFEIRVLGDISVNEATNVVNNVIGDALVGHLGYTLGNNAVIITLDTASHSLTDVKRIFKRGFDSKDVRIDVNQV